MSNPISYKTSSPSGDLISFLSGIKQIWVDTGRKAILYHRLGMIGGSYEGADSAYEDENKNPICFNQYTFDMMRPLLLSQEYIEDYIVFEGQQYEIDFDKVRLEIFTNQPKGSLNQWPGFVFPQMITDLADKWISIPKIDKSIYVSELEYGFFFNGGIGTVSDKVIINFTERHRNNFMHYFFLKEFQDRLIFAGLEHERDKFCEEWKLDIPLLLVSNFYELAKAVNECMFFMGNQSFCFQLAESLKVARILEVFPMMPNVISVGKNALYYYHQQAAEFNFYKLLKNEKESSQRVEKVGGNVNSR